MAHDPIRFLRPGRFIPVALLAIPVGLCVLWPTEIQAQNQSTEQSEITELDSRCLAAFRADDYGTATSVCQETAEAYFAEANESISLRTFYYLDLLNGAQCLEIAGMSYVYGHIDNDKGRELVDEAIVALHKVLDGATDAGTIEEAQQALAQATSFESKLHQ